MRLLDALLEQLPIDDPEGQLEKVAAEDDYLDALICALVARAAERKRTYRPETAHEAQRAAVEGWIHLPRDPLKSLAYD
jgi:predicted RNase H-like nuclease